MAAFLVEDASADEAAEVDVGLDVVEATTAPLAEDSADTEEVALDDPLAELQIT